MAEEEKQPTAWDAT